MELSNFNIDYYEPGTTLRQIIETQVADTSRRREDYDDAFYVVDLGKVVSQFKRWKECLPRVQPFYAIKSNPDPLLLRVLNHMGAGLDCASKRELATALSLKVSRENIIYAHTCKQESHVTFAKQNGVSLMTFDNEDELVKIKKLHPEASLVLRLATEDPSSTLRLSAKYGCEIVEIQYLLMTAKQMDLNVVGICFYVGKMCQDPESFSAPIKNARRAFDVANQMGFKMEILDIGGGFPGDFRDKPRHFENMAEVINRELEHNFAASSNPGLRIIGEPGRYFSGPGHTLVLNVIARRCNDKTKRVEFNNKAPVPTTDPSQPCHPLATRIKEAETPSPQFQYYLNDGFHGSLLDIYLRQLELVPSCLQERKCDDLKYSCTLWGHTCDGIDFITKHCAMPMLQVGEWVFFKDIGAYTKACASTFNGFSIPVCHYVAPKHVMSFLNKMST